MREASEYVEKLKQWVQEIKQWTHDENINHGWLQTNIKELEHLLVQVRSPETLPKNQLFQLQQKAGKIDEWIRQQSNGAVWVTTYVVPPGQHQLPQLPYPYNSLEPYISEEIMRLHHDKHHQSYVDGLNKAEQKLQEARKTGDFSLVKHWERELAFHGSGHYLHTIFWENMSPEGGGKPKGDLARTIESYFGSFASFKKQFTEAANQVEGVGWALLVWSPRSRHLEILQSERHMNLTQWDTIPLLVLDVWEHAYYLQYKNDRQTYVNNWWNVVNWNDVEQRFQKAKTLKWKPY
jgi:superoxide dismutase, Fe-Mn family